MLHRLIFAFTLIASFVFAQVGAITHEISHYTSNYNSTTSQSKSQDSLPHHQVCEKCLSYAELGHAINSADTNLPIIEASHYYLVRHLPSFSYSKPATYRARAPPYLA